MEAMDEEEVLVKLQLSGFGRRLEREKEGLRVFSLPFVIAGRGVLFANCWTKDDNHLKLKWIDGLRRRLNKLFSL
jgi:hypothetical protein